MPDYFVTVEEICKCTVTYAVIAKDRKAAEECDWEEESFWDGEIGETKEIVKTLSVRECDSLSHVIAASADMLEKIESEKESEKEDALK